ncbi:MAG: DUF1015 domain-containing protein [Lachnospiraceae bacterium]|nr:DUF1015 domain-containing protein [Lachnospiraceae bacterium]
MATIKPFKAIRPAREYADQIAALPYDVYNRAEACREVKHKPHSFLRIDRAETNYDDSVDTYEDIVYQRAHDMLWQWVDEGYFIREDAPCYYIYELTMDGRSQTGIVACASIDDYEQGIIKKHENTRAEKERDRIRHVDECNAQTGPIFLAYRNRQDIDEVTKRVTAEKCEYDFTADDGVRHRVWVIRDSGDIDTIEKSFGDTDSIYIADGHHRAASAVKVGQKRRGEHPDYDGSEEFNFFLSVLFPEQELAIMDYNRVVRDLNGLSEEDFMERITQVASEIKKSQNILHPEKKGQFVVYLSGTWYLFEFVEGVKNDDPVDGLDVALLQNYVLDPILGIADPTTDDRIDFIGGIRGFEELRRRCENDMKVAFGMYPTSIGELFAVADAGRLMPPKSTWFEPKLRSGLFIHEI